ncbi:TetR/AcrR family transcriptional regulator [Nocardia pseudovaccinii]|uniref:TetR/AcrR family transcriptional regulator n=1 Tax=Nocardia pseudovaccinii TaxID=189540 RepID=UPI003D8DC418
MSNYNDAYTRDPEATRQRLLEAAISIAAQDGQAAVTYRAVAQATGVAHSLVRHYFGSREALMREALESASRRDIAQLGLESTTSIGMILADLPNQLQSEGARRSLITEFILSATRGQQPVELARELIDLSIDEARAALRAVGLTDDDRQLAMLVIAVVDGISLQHPLYQSVERTESILECLRMLLRLARESRPAMDASGAAGQQHSE